MDYKWLFENWSKSKIKAGETCVYSLVLQAKGIKSPSNTFSEIGNEIHSFLEEYVKLQLKRKIEIDILEQLPTIKQHPTIENFVKLEKERVENVESVWWDVEHYVEVSIPASELVKHDEKWEQIQQHIKQHFSYDFNGLVLKGFIDRVDDLNGKKILIDYKTGSLDYVDMDEMWFYALLWWLKYSEIPKIVVLYGLKEGRMKWQYIDEEMLKQYYNQILHRIQKTIFNIFNYFESGELEKNCNKCWWKSVCDLKE